ncbi:MAG TPA: hypothetical protein VFT95_00875, partial [Micromonosporaceae bacterium]|nr:hypothetical protein [Micromonosporaceae bacterium]
ESAPEPSASPPPSAPVSPPAPLDRAPAEPFTAARDADRRPEHGDATPAPEPAPPHRSRFGLRRHRASAPPDEAPDTAGRDAAPKAANEPAKEPAKEPAEADAEADAAPVTKRRSRLGLRRREAAAPRPRAEAEPLGADDAEYVDWVSGLGEDSPGRRRER